jgi:hypothetical protein
MSGIILGYFFVVAHLACAEAPERDALEGGLSCTQLVSGIWTASGDAFGMDMQLSLEMNDESCSFTFDNWDMAMDELPTGGVIDGTRVQLDAPTDLWRSCTGNAASSVEITGNCADDGTAFSLVGGDAH